MKTYDITTNYLGHQVSGNLLLEEVKRSHHFYESEFFYLDLLSMNFTPVELVSQNAKMLDVYTSQIFF